MTHYIITAAGTYRVLLAFFALASLAGATAERSDRHERETRTACFEQLEVKI